MKLIKKHITGKNSEGSVKLRAEEESDMWHAFHLIGIGDYLKTSTLRKVVREGATGSVTSNKIKMNIKIEVQNINFDSGSCTLHVAGVNVEENPHVKLGAYHTVHLELNRDFELTKDTWDSISLERLNESTNPERGAEVAVIAMELGLAHLCLISGHMTITKAKLDTSIPKKRSGASGHDKAIQRFYNNLYAAITKHIDFSKIKCVLIGSPGFVASDFMKSMLESAVRNNDRMIIENKARFTTCHASGGHKRAIFEMISNPEVATQLLETRVVDDVKAFQAFTEMLKNDPDRAYYGYNHVLRADEELAVDTLMVTDNLFKSCDVATRLKYVKLCESVKEHNGKVHIFSSLHVSGEQLTQVTGIAAILRFPLPEEKIMEGNGDGDEDSDSGSDDGEDRQMNKSFQISRPASHGHSAPHPPPTRTTGPASAAEEDSDSGSEDFQRDDGAAEAIRDMGF